MLVLRSSGDLPDQLGLSASIPAIAIGLVYFVLGYFLFGLVTPFVLMLMLARSMAGASEAATLAVTTIGALLGLIGGLILRHAVLVCGALPTLNIAGFEFRRIARPKEPKPAAGSLPPH